MCSLVSPPQYLVAVAAVDINHCMEACDEHPVLPLTDHDVHRVGEQESPAIPSLKFDVEINRLLETHALSMKSFIHWFIQLNSKMITTRINELLDQSRKD